MLAGAAVNACSRALPLTGTVKVPSETRWGWSGVSAAPTAQSSYSLPALGGRMPWMRTSKLRPPLVLVTSTRPFAVPPSGATRASSVAAGRLSSSVAGMDSSTTSAAATAVASHGRRPRAANRPRPRRRSSSLGRASTGGTSSGAARGPGQQLGQPAQLLQLAPAVVALGQVRLERDRLVVVELAEGVAGHLDVRRGVVRHAPHAPPGPA